ncbi:uncharacterized protein LOC132293269 isoform X2 [Cornus florida]|uniref:uncharacterized protein LOC132293269 isoform X2 n=1 Tax=Cornus florida TaxID=4283 RepID=UPI00289AE899|nr:uncharacterized protein LOC132293269 isoform X2 [Cornus florida]
MASGCVRQLFNPTRAGSQLQFFLPQLVPHRSFVFISWDNRRSSKLPELCQHHRNLTAVSKALSETDGITQADDDDGVSLGTMKLPLDTDIPRFETLLFQVDKIPNGARLGFITIGDGMTEVLVYIDCLVFPAPDGTGPIFRAVRNGPLKDQSPPGEPRIMRSLLGALKKSVEIARI